MTKELLENLLIEFDEMGYEPTILCDTKKEVESFRNRLKQVLDYLKSLDNVNPSEALRKLDDILNKVFDYGVQSVLDNLLLRGYNTKNMLKQECLGKTLDYDLDEAKTKIINLNDYPIIKQALLKAQEQEKVLEIVKKKTVSIFQLGCCKNVNEYNDLKFIEFEKLTQEEFDLLKEVLK